MQIDRRITNGLAWAGLFIVVAVPVADAVSGQLMGEPNRIAVASIDAPAVLVAPVPAPLSQRPHAPAARPAIETAAVAPAKPVAPAAVKPVIPAAAKPVAAANPVVDSFLSSGKPLPSYITGDHDAPQQAAATSAAAPAASKPVATTPIQTAAVPGQPVAPPQTAVDPIEVATLTPAKVAPMPMPLSMRPKPVARPLASQSNEDIVLPPDVVAGNDARPIVVDDLQDWESGPLSEFLAQRQRSSAVVRQNDAYSEDRPVLRPRRDVYLGPADDEGFFPFIN
jgi:hypothetical protein